MSTTLRIGFWLSCSLFPASVDPGNPLNGQHLQVITGELPGVFAVIRDSRGKSFYTGPAYELIDWLSKRLNFTYDLELMERYKFGEKLSNGSFDGFVGYAERKEKDISLSPLGMYRDYLDVADMSFVWAVYDFSMMIPYPSPQDKTWAALKPFQINVWMGFLGSFLVFSVTILIFVFVQTNILVKKIQSFKHWSDPVIYQAGVITAQGGYLSSKGRPVIFLATLWAWTAFVFVCTYSSLLISFLSTSKLDPPVDDLPSLAQAVQQKDFPFFIFRSSIADETFLLSPNSYYKVLGDWLREHPEARVINGPTCLRTALEHRGICIDAVAGIDYFIQQDMKASGKCRVTRGKETFTPAYSILLFQKHGPYSKTLNQQILWTHDTGLSQYWQSGSAAKPYRCLERPGNEAQIRPLALRDLASAFLILGIGISAGILLFLSELIVKV